MVSFSAVTSSGFISPSFRLFVLVVGIPFSVFSISNPTNNTSFARSNINLALEDQNTFTSSQLVLSKCDIISIDCPTSVKNAFSSTIRSIKKSQYNTFASKLALFDSAAVITNCMAHNGNPPSFYTFLTALQCSKDASDANTYDLGNFIINFVYGADAELSDEDRDLRGIWERICFNNHIYTQYPLPNIYMERHIQSSIDSMPPIDDPLVFGLNPAAFDFFKSRFLETASHVNVQRSTIGISSSLAATASNLNAFHTFSNSTNLLTLKINSLMVFERHLSIIAETNYSLDSQRERQLISSSSNNSVSLDLSLLYMPDVMINQILVDDFLKTKDIGKVIVVREAILTKSQNNDCVDKLVFSGLFVKGALLEKSGVFSKHNGFSKLPLMEFVPMDIQEKNNLYPVFLFHNGKHLTTVYVQKDDKDTDMYLFSYSNSE